MKIINPNLYSYAFNFGKYDCFKVLTGKCSLELTEEEYNYYKPLTKRYGDGSVDYCRQMADYFLTKGLFKKDTNIIAYKFECGHIAFGDGQHRTCIAKKIGVEKLAISYFKESKGICRVCYFEEQERNTPYLKRILKKICKKTDGKDKDFIDDSLKVNHITIK